ncbi:MAG: hypothetical protein WCS20_16400, partial [Alphaproteobacteria bacterium]
LTEFATGPWFWDTAECGKGFCGQGIWAKRMTDDTNSRLPDYALTSINPPSVQICFTIPWTSAISVASIFWQFELRTAG